MFKHAGSRAAPTIKIIASAIVMPKMALNIKE